MPVIATPYLRWIVLAPLIGTILCLYARRPVGSRSRPWSGRAPCWWRSRSPSPRWCSSGRCRAGARWSTVLHLDPGVAADARAGLPRRRLTSVMILIITGIGFLIHLYSLGYMQRRRGRGALLRVPEPVHRLDADAGARRLAAGALHRLGGRRPLLVPADRLLVRRTPPTPSAGRKAFIANRVGDAALPDRHVPALLEPRTTLGAAVAAPSSDVNRLAPQARREWSHRHVVTAICLLLLLGAHRQVGADPALRLAARRDGRPDAGLGADPRRHHGHRRRLHDRAPLAAVRALAGTRWPWSRSIGAVTALFAATIALRAERPEEDPRLLDRLASSATCSSPSASARSRAGVFHLITHAFFKALPLPRRRQRHARDAGRARRPQDGRAEEAAADHPRAPS